MSFKSRQEMQSIGELINMLGRAANLTKFAHRFLQFTHS